MFRFTLSFGSTFCYPHLESVLASAEVITPDLAFYEAYIKTLPALLSGVTAVSRSLQQPSSLLHGSEASLAPEP
jgi:hypothetical protein